ncbi:MAG: phosphoribosyltransferase [Bacillota bacterium]
MLFRDRYDAGLRLARAVKGETLPGAVALCIPRGGVVVGSVVAEELKIPLDLIIPRKIGAPANPEVAIGAVAQDGSAFLNESLVSAMGIGPEELDRLVQNEVAEIKRRMTAYRGSTEYGELSGEGVILVDDGAATGYTMLAAARFCRKTLRPACLVIAVPVAPPETVALFNKEADRVVCLHSPEEFYAVGQFYIDFSQTEDNEVLSILKKCGNNYLHSG